MGWGQDEKIFLTVGGARLGRLGLGVVCDVGLQDLHANDVGGTLGEIPNPSVRVSGWGVSMARRRGVVDDLEVAHAEGAGAEGGNLERERERTDGASDVGNALRL